MNKINLIDITWYRRSCRERDTRYVYRIFDGNSWKNAV
jgi:hypothetical protein